MKVERATEEDHVALTALTKKSKAFWGYSPQQMRSWDEVLTITQDYISNNETFKLVSEDKIIGYYSLLSINAETLKIDNLFICPDFIGKGHGKILMNHIFQKAVSEKCTAIILESDPNAELFYSRFGFTTIRQTETSPGNRSLPLMKFTL